MPEIANILSALASAPGEPAALVTVVQVEGSSYRRPGARLLVFADGRRTGSVSGGCLEDDVVLRAQKVLASGRAAVAVYDTTSENDLVWGVGPGCQGIVHLVIEPLAPVRPAWIGVLGDNQRARRKTALAVGRNGDPPPGTGLAGDTRPAAGPAGFFLETIPAPPALVVFGAGDDAQPLVRLAKETGWHVTVVDARAAYATRERFPSADAVVVSSAATLDQCLALEPQSYAVVMTHRFLEDGRLLRALLPRPLAYLGQLGPRQRTDRLLDQLRAEGFVPDAAMRERFHAPVGLNLGGSTPETIALAILAEMQCRRTGRTPGHLRDCGEPLHG